MCHSGYWAEAARRQAAKEAKEKEARERRTETVNSLLATAQKKAEEREPAQPRETAPAK
jgi:hypothetical protein